MDQAPMQQPTAPTGQSNNPLANLPGGLGQKKVLYIVVGVVALGVIGMFARGMFYRSAGNYMAQRAIENATGGQVKYNGDNTVTYKGKEGEMQVRTNATLPSDWPSDIPIVPAAKIIYSGTTNFAAAKPTVSVMFSTSETVDNVAAYYNKELVTNGWKVDVSSNFSGSAIISATKDTRVVSISIGTSGGTTSVTLGVQKQ